MRDWNQFIEDAVKDIRAQTNGKPVLAALSGGVDSSVAAVLTHRAVGQRLTCLFVDHGLMRLDEGDEVERVFRGQFDIRLVRVNAQERFLGKLAGETDPERKRKIIGSEFIKVFEEEAKKLDGIGFLMQGTIYTDVTESGQDGHKAVKAHHNVGGLPELLPFDGLVEPLRPLYKHEVRDLGDALGLPPSLTRRQPFPGPGLGVRVLGEVTAERLDILRVADAVFREEMDRAGVASDEYFAIHTGLNTVGVRDGARVFGHLIALRAVKTDDLVTAGCVRVPYDVLDRAASRITSECPGVCRVVYDITAKPPGTIEWE
jgi:GMP synthase (glutamine-hydrolysing)